MGSLVGGLRYFVGWVGAGQGQGGRIGTKCDIIFGKPPNVQCTYVCLENIIFLYIYAEVLPHELLYRFQQLSKEAILRNFQLKQTNCA